jgi:hypothetical protein
VENSCELGNKPSGSIKCWELPSGCTTCDLSSGTQLHRVSYSHIPDYVVLFSSFLAFLQFLFSHIILFLSLSIEKFTENAPLIKLSTNVGRVLNASNISEISYQ